MRFAGFQKLTLLDFPGKTACTAFTAGCNFRCPFCHNASLVEPGAAAQDIEAEEILAFLSRRRGLLDGLCLTGGEPTLHRDLADFCRSVKELSFLVKLDTNGTRPDVIESLIRAGLVDYVAMDIKNGPSRFAETAGVSGLDLAPIQESIALLKQNLIPYEFRTTVVEGMHDAESLLEAAEMLQGAKAWYLQQFVDSGNCLRAGLRAYPGETLHTFAENIRPLVPSVAVRGVE